MWIGRCSYRVANHGAHDKVEVFNLYKAMKFPSIYEELSAITLIYPKSELALITSNNPLERALVGYDIFGDAEADKMIQILDVASILIHKGEFETLKKPLVPYCKSSIKKAPKLELKALPPHLKYIFLGDNDTLLVILSARLSDIQV